MDIAGDAHVVRCHAKAEHLRVEPNWDVKLVFARHEQNRIPAGNKLGVLLDRVDAIDCQLHLSGRSMGVEHENAGAEGVPRNLREDGKKTDGETDPGRYTDE